MVLLSNWSLSMFGLSFWYFLYPYMHISPFFLLWMLSSCFYCFVFFLRKKRLCFCFHYFHVAGLVHLWNGQFLLSVTSSTPISVYEFIWQLEGCFYSFMSFFFPLPAISVAVSPFFSFFMWFCSFLNCTVSPSIVTLYWMESSFALFVII